MNSQPDMYYDYPPSNANRSPGSTRQGYATVGMHSGMGGARGQRSMEFGGQNLSNSALYGSDDRSGGYDSMSRFDRLGPSAMQSSYMLENSQTWGYNGGVPATMNGPMNGNGRMGGRASNRRAALPSTWTDQSNLGGMHSMPQLYDPNMGMNGSEHDLASMAGAAADTRGMMTTPGSGADEQLIPTAIVIKNIQFQCRKEILQGLMASMNLPQPYAFNYHFDKGVFRGLAFANFSTAEDTAIVIQKMNGLEVMGRKLRVEYKKMLPQDERDRIDREKREKRGQLEEQHRAPLPLHQQSALQALGVVNKQGGNSPLRDVDLNDPATLQFYTELTIFKTDPSREVHIFSPDVAPEQRRQIHILAHNMGLEHRSVGEADRRQIQIMKRPQHSPPIHAQHQLPPNVSWEDHRRGLSRAATFDFAESRVGSSAYHTLGRQGPTLELPGSPDNGMGNNLRAAKSFADLRTHSPSPAPSGSSYAGLGNGLGARYGDFSQNSLATPPNLTPTSAQNAGSSTDALLAGNMNTMSLGFDSNGSHMRPRENPGAIGSQRPGANGTGRNAPDRQPRGPEWGETPQGFNGRSRGHMQRGSDSSDAGRSSGASRFH